MADTLFDNAIKFGFRYGGKQTLHVAATNADYVNRQGAAFVHFKQGVARMCATTTASVDGWLEMPKETTHGESVRLDGNEYSVLTDPSAVFEAPVNEKLASLTATHVGNFGYPVDIGSGTSKKQYVRIQANKSKPATPLLLIRDVDVDNKSVFVSINPNKLS